MNGWLVYWTPDDVDDFYRYEKFRVDCVGSNQKRFSKFERGDMVWIHTIDIENYHWLLGRIILESKMDLEQTQFTIGRKLVTGGQFSEYWIGEKPWNKMVEINIGDLIREMQFDPIKPVPSEYSGKHFQQIRKLSEKDSALISERWDAYFG